MDKAKPTKAELEREARIQARAAAGAVPPPSTDLSHLDELPDGVAPPAGTPDETAAPPVAAAKPAAKPRAAKPAKAAKPRKAKPAAAPGAHVHRRADDPAPPLKLVPPAEPPAAEQPAEPAPWCNAHPKMTQPYALRVPEELYMKLGWLKKNLPDTSIQRLLILAAEEKVEELLALHYKPKAANK